MTQLTIWSISILSNASSASPTCNDLGFSQLTIWSISKLSNAFAASPTSNDMGFS